MVNSDRCNRSWSSLDDFSCKICVLNKTEDVSNLITKTIGSKTLQNMFSYDCKCIFRGRKSNSNQKLNNYFSQCLCQHSIKHPFLINYYVSNPRMYACETNSYLKSIACDLVITFDEIIDAVVSHTTKPRIISQ